jgi:uncharacterized UBP type Zn finger protein
MKQSAVEFLVELLNNINNDFNSSFKEEIEQAKEIEKQQIIESYCQGCFDISLNKNIFPRETSEQYYNETFKTK